MRKKLILQQIFRPGWVIFGTLCLGFIPFAQAEPNLNGETGYINMPNGRIEQDGTFRMGDSFAKPYSSLWTSITFLPRVEFYARYTRIMTGAIGNGSPTWQGYGDYKDKVASGKVLLLEEDRIKPSLVVGMNDLQGTEIFSSKYLAASKQFGALEATLGVGEGRIDGAFAGARYAPETWRGFAMAVEYDANNYKQDFASNQTGVAQRNKGVGLALEYQRGWLGSQLSYRAGKSGLNIFVTIPFGKKEFVPKIKESPADTEIVVRPSLDQWNVDQKFRDDLMERLLKQDFKNIQVDVSGQLAEVTLTNTRISLPSRAVGRAARSILLCTPHEVRELKINYTVSDMPFITYTFSDAYKLQGYFNGQLSRKQLAPSVSINYANPQQRIDKAALTNDPADEYSSIYLDGTEGDIVSLRSENGRLDKIRVAPGMGLYFNDPSGALRYDTSINATFGKQVSTGLFFNATTQLSLWQNVSGVREPSNSLLPHVRSDVADYKKNGSLKLTQALLNKFYHPRQRLYARTSAGLYEEMFGGVGGQVLFYPEQGSWAFDFSLDALRQRDTGGGLAFRSYSTVTALAAFHYRLPFNGLTATVRAGRFLAKDNGTRFEIKRRFHSGFEFGGWYSMTNGRDVTSPGTPAQPYHDKGVFLSIPLGSLLTRDTQARSRISISPWTRDVGQMVVSPGDLYDMLEPAYINMRDHDGLQYLGDLEDDYK